MRFRTAVLFIFCLHFTGLLCAQQPVFKFLSDSVKVGEHVKGIFYFQHKSNQEIFFPDSSFLYSPFEFISKTYYPTRTINGISTDSAVYTFALYEIEGTHALSLPAMLLTGKDTVKISSNTDSLTIIPTIPVFIDSLQFRSNTTPLGLERKFNYLIVIIISFGFLVLLLVLYLLFGESIRNLFAKNRGKRAHEKFLKSFEALVTNRMDSSKMEAAVSLWKKYIEGLDKKPFTTYTSSEIAFHLKNESIKKNLQNIDVAIYSGRSGEVAVGDFDKLKQVATEMYLQKQGESQK